MRREDFAATRRRVLALHADGDYAAAMDVARSAARDFPEHADQTTYLVALRGEPEVVLKIIEGGLERSRWWAPEMVEGDPDLRQLRTSDRFRRVVAASMRARAAAGRALPIQPLIREPVDPPALAALVVLHGRGQTAEDAVERWEGARRALLVVPRSTQLFGMRTACWDDPQRAEADVQRAVDIALQRDDAGALPLVLAGFSQGAGLAIVLAVRRRLPGVVGIVAVAPGGGWALEVLRDDRLSGEGLRGYFVIGELDPVRAPCHELAKRLVAAGAEIRLDVLARLEHEYPADFEERLPPVLDWVLDVGAAHRP